MKMPSTFLAALVTAGVMAAPAWSRDTGRPAADAMNRTEVTVRPSDDDTIAHINVVQGQVAAVDHQSGRLILDTDFGLLHLRAEPALLEGVQEGDVNEVALVE